MAGSTSEELDELYAEKRSIIEELFIHTADENYITARWCFHQNLNVDFFWLAVHCVEKYLKACLLFNGGTSTNYSHDIETLYTDVKAFAADLLPSSPEKPPRMPANMWRHETFEQFISRLYRDGHAHNRYQLYGYSRMPEDLWKLDQLVFNIRRICCPLDVCIIDGVPSFRHILKSISGPCQHFSKLEDALKGKLGEEIKVAAANWNFPFTSEQDRHAPATYAYSSRESVFVRRFFDPLRIGSSEFAKNDELWSWVKTKITLPEKLVHQIEVEREKIKRQDGE